MSIHFSSETDLWSTPQNLFDKLNEEFKFTLDVCATSENAKCEQFYTELANGLTKEWLGTCWMNPPYGTDLKYWIRKAYLSSLRGTTVVCLTPARTETEWWWRYCIKGEIRFIKGRLRFSNMSVNAPFPSAIIIFPSTPKVIWWDEFDRTLGR